jgi:hypothetical protein
MMNDEKNIRENSSNSWAVFVWDFELLNFEFVSDFVLCASDLLFYNNATFFHYCHMISQEFHMV